MRVGALATISRLSLNPPSPKTYQSFILEACSLATSSLNCQKRET